MRPFLQKKNLFHKRVFDSALRPICEQVEETTCHALWNCGAASDVWAEHFSVLQKWQCTEEDFCSV